MTTGKKPVALIIWIFVSKVMSLFLNMLSRFVIAFLPRSKHLLISWQESPCAVTLEPKKVCHCLHFLTIYLPWVDGTRCHDLSFWMLRFKPAFLLSSFTFIKRFLYTGLPWWLRQYRICLQWRWPGFDPWVGKISWRREWLPTPVFRPVELHGQRSLAG